MHHTTKKILQASLAIIATLVYLELGIRRLASSALPLLRTDPEVGSIHVPNFSGYIWDERSNTKQFITTNHLGYIGEEFPDQKASDTIRIAVLGDSVVEALQVDVYRNFVSRLQNALNVSRLCHKTFEVMNFGVGGTGTFLQYQTYKKKVAPLKPDYVFLVFHDDYSDNLQKANFDLDEYASQRKNVGLKTFLLRFQLPKLLFSKLQSNSSFIKVLTYLGLYEAATKPTNLSTDTNETTAARPSDEEPQAVYDYTFFIVNKLKELVEREGSKLVVVIYPPEKNFSHENAWQADPHTTRLIDFLEKQKILYFNPAPALTNLKLQTPNCLTFNCEDHLNAQGHEAMARVLYTYLKDSLLTSSLICPENK